MINSMNTKMPLQSTGMTEILLPNEGNPETSQTFKIECQSNCAAMSSKWCILAVTLVSLDKRRIILSRLIFALCLPEETMLHAEIFLLFKNVRYSRAMCFCQFCFKLGELIQRQEMLQKAFDNESMSWTQTWVVEMDKSGGNSIEDSPRSGRKSTSPDEKHVVIVCEVIHSNRCLTVWEVSD